LQGKRPSKPYRGSKLKNLREYSAFKKNPVGAVNLDGAKAG